LVADSAEEALEVVALEAAGSGLLIAG